MIRSIRAAALAAALVLAPSCALLETETTQPAELWVRASRRNFDVLAGRLAVYVAADATLLPITRDALLAMLADWDFLIRQGEELYGGPPAGPPPTGPYPGPGDTVPAGGER